MQGLCPSGEHAQTWPGVALPAIHSASVEPSSTEPLAHTSLLAAGMDLLFVGISVAFFVVTYGLQVLCERLAVTERVE